MQTTGYSGTPLAKKLGIRPGFKIALINAPEYYLDLFTDLPPDVVFTNNAGELKNLIHLFVKDKAGYLALLPQIKTQIVQNGSIWVSWPKKASKVPTDITEDIIRNYALETGLVDVKVCAVDEIWSGLKLMIRVVDRVKSF
jgi:hypothetical protein